MRKYLFLFFVIFFIQFDVSVAQIAFQKKYGSTFFEDPRSVQQTFDGGYIVVGKLERFGPLYDILIIRTNPVGDTLWTKIFDSTQEQAWSVQQTTDSGFILTGYSNLSMFAMRLDQQGNVLWTKTYTGAAIGKSVLQTNDEGFLFTGSTNVDPNGMYDLLLVRTDPNGDTLWVRKMGGFEREDGVSSCKKPNGGYMIGGITGSFGEGYFDIYVISIDENGDTLWTKSYGDLSINILNSISPAIGGGYVISGWTQEPLSSAVTYQLLKIDTSGNIEWNKSFFDPMIDSYPFATTTSDSGFILTGSFDNNIVLIKTDMYGDTIWTRTLFPVSSQGSNQIARTNDGGFIISGYKNNLDSLIGDFYLIKTDANGPLTCNLSNRNITLTFIPFQSSFTNTVIQRGLSSVQSANFPVMNNYPIYVKDVCSPTSIMKVEFSDKLTIYPNPATDLVTLDLDEYENVIVSIFDNMEKLILEKKLEGRVISLADFSDGIYFVRIRTNEKIISGKLIVCRK